TPVLYTLSLHDALPILVEFSGKIFLSAKHPPSLATVRQAPKAAKIGPRRLIASRERSGKAPSSLRFAGAVQKGFVECGWEAEHRSEEHTSELQSLAYLV